MILFAASGTASLALREMQLFPTLAHIPLHLGGRSIDHSVVRDVFRHHRSGGDNGIVTVVEGEQQGDTLDLRLWLMSCRVLKRGMEDAMMDTLVAEAAARGVKTIVGHYYPTAKNAMVREFYAQFGFAKVAEDADGNTEWRLDVSTYAPKHPHMKIER